MQKNIILRDVKPGNILIDHSGDKDDNMKTVHVSKLAVKLCDFGMSRIIPSLGSTLTMTLAGTKEYMPPEAREDLEDENSTTHSTLTFDTFSAGVVTHEMTTGCLCSGIFLENM